jgi:hypothetical protein
MREDLTVKVGLAGKTHICGVLDNIYLQIDTIVNEFRFKR